MSYRDGMNEHCGFSWFSDLKTAEEAAREHRARDSAPCLNTAKVESWEVPHSKPALLALLRDVAGHADNG